MHCMKTKTFSVVTSIALVLTVLVTTLSVIGITIAGVYPGIFVFIILALIATGSKFFSKRLSKTASVFKRRYFTMLTLINLLVILVVLWMTLVNVYDRVLKDCC